MIKEKETKGACDIFDYAHRAVTKSWFYIGSLKSAKWVGNINTTEFPLKKLKYLLAD